MSDSFDADGEKIAVMDTHLPNAFATGRNPGNAVVTATRGLLSRLNDREVEAVLGHEMAHVKNREYAADRGGRYCNRRADAARLGTGED